MASALVKELEPFRVKITARANETFASGREAARRDMHDSRAEIPEFPGS